MREVIRYRITWLNQASLILLALVTLSLIASVLWAPPAALTTAESVTPTTTPHQISKIHAPQLPVSPTPATGQVVSDQPPSLMVKDTPTPSASPVEPPTAEPARRIGILAGHWQYDTGAICPDGLREVDITLSVAQQVVARLQQLGYEVDLLPEHDPDDPQPPLQGYQAAAFVSIHADSCNVPGATGFKVARWRYSPIPEIEDRLVGCLQTNYAQATGLSHHDDSITIDMWNYYAFREIAVETPGAIVELGFMGDDRQILVARQADVVNGIVNGILCFLRS